MTTERVTIADDAKRLDAWERLCDPTKGCQAKCCYYEGSPCEELNLSTLTCRTYPNRFGLHKTVSGVEFQCVPFHVALQHQPAPEKCGYAGITQINGVPIVRGQR